MQFKSLFIQGFKSFVDKTIIDFPLGITAIVGPNGSGKSNIMDALRWVFGEQRASELRGGDMEDVIFAGSDKRRSSGYAEVGLTLSDIPADVATKWGTFSDITVSRKIYRSGEREYFINNRRCRLKDIKDIFFDTGLGAKSISIIEQERVTKIVNSTPEELRYFLEETAGVVRYKERRKEAETRLRQTEDNLSRINDLLSIMVEDIERLSVQVEQLNIYKGLRIEKLELEKAFLCVTYAKIQKDAAAHKKSVESLRFDLGELVGSNQGKINLETDLQREQENLRQALKTMRYDHNDIRERLAFAESNIRQMDSNITSAGTQMEQLNNDLEQNRTRLEKLEERSDQVADLLDEADEYMGDFEESVQELHSEMLDIRMLTDRANNDLKSANSDYLKATQAVTEISNNINIKQSEAASHETAVMRLKREQENLSADTGDLFKKATVAKEMMEELAVQMEYSRNQEQIALDELNEKEDELRIAKDTIAKLEIRLNTSRNKVSMLQKELDQNFAGKKATLIIERYKGFPYTSVNSSSEAFILYSDLIVVPDDNVKALVDSAADYDFSFRFIPQSLSHQLSPAKDLVEIGNNLYLSGNIYRKVGNDDPAVLIRELQMQLDAEKEAISSMEDEYTDLTDNISYLVEDMADIKAFYNKHAAEIKKLETEFTSHKVTLENMEEHKERTTKHLAVIEKEIGIAEDGITECRKAAESMRSKRDALLEEQADAEGKRAAAEEKTEALLERLEEVREAHSAAQRELTKYSERKQSLNNELKQISRDKILIEETIQTLVDRLEELSDVKVEEWKELMKKAEEEKRTLQIESLELTDKINLAEQNQQDNENRLYELREQLSNINNEIHSIELKITEQLTRIESADINMRSLSEQMQESYSIIIEDIWEQYNKKYHGRQQVEAEMAKVEQAVNDLGSLNMAADDEFAKKSAEYQRQTEQQADIESAIINLQELISEIDESTVKLFEETFTAVRENFIEVFNKFFGSGHADLTLTDPENMLTTGVEITIHPPGKKVNHKNLLSGGEKALSALTLLFALFLQRPTPFCFLDEVDAPLDDANVGRFINMVSSMAQRTQFVIITHKHQTMASANSLYGVTMQEAGVSTILSVELNRS